MSTCRIVSILLLSALPASAWAADARPRGGQASARPPRTMDDDALWAKKAAIRSIGDILRRQSLPPEQMIELRLRYSQTLQEIAAIQYRLAYDKAGAKRLPDLTEYKASLRASVDPLNKLISTNPDGETLAMAYHLRSRALVELEEKDAALADLRHLVDTWPNSRVAPLAHIALWELLSERKQYADVIRYIGRYGLRPNDKLYSAALDKLAFSYYMLNDLPSALKYSEYSARHFTALRRSGNDKVADRERVMTNLALYYGTAVANRHPATPSAQAIPYFKKMYDGADLEKVIIQYGYVLRTKGLDEEIEELQRTSAREPLSDGFRSDMILLAYENQLNHMRIAQIEAYGQAEINLLQASQTLKTDEKRLTQISKTFSGALVTLHKELQKYTGHPNAKPIAGSLISLYRFFLAWPTQSKDEPSKLRFNLAELLYLNGDPEAAIVEYRRIVDFKDGRSNTRDPSYAKILHDANLKSIAVRFEVLKQKQMVPTTLVAKRLQTSAKDMPEQVTQWIGWIDQFRAAYPADAESSVFYFESNRAYYHYDEVATATRRLLDLVRRAPGSPQAVPSASLVIDTYIASEMWVETYKLARELQKMQGWTESGFVDRLAAIEADAYFKDVEISYKDKEYEEALRKVDEYLVAVPRSKRTPDLLELAANAKLAMQDTVGASKYFAALKRQAVPLKTEALAADSVTSANIAETAYDFPAALGGYRNYLTLAARSKGVDQAHLEKMREKTLYTAWINGQASEINATLKHPGICTPALAAKCERYRVSAYLLNPTVVPPASEASRKTGPDQAIWAAVALKYPGNLPYHERLRLLQLLHDQWGSLDAITQYTVLPVLLRSSRDAFKLARDRVRQEARVTADPKSIAKRVKALQEAEERMSKLASSPWLGIRGQRLRETGGLYRDLSADIGALPVPAGLAGPDMQAYLQTINELKAPFDQKAMAYEEQARSLIPGAAPAAPTGQAGEVVLISNGERVSAEWLLPILPKDSKRAQNLSRAFTAAVAANNWPKIAYLVQEAKAPSLLPDGVPTLFEAVSLAKAGATPEAEALLAEAMPKLDKTTKLAVTAAVMQWSWPRKPASAGGEP